MKTDPRGVRAAFTLLEMAVVLAILALVTHLAVVRLDADARPARASRQLEEIRRAIAGSDDDRDPAGQPSLRGFVADMGRLPVSLDELWRQGTNAAFAVRQAPDDPQAWVPGGWRGPYLRHGVRRETLSDPWGNPVGYVPRADGSFLLVSHGSDGSPGWDGATDAARDIALTNAPGTASLTILPHFFVRMAEDGETASEGPDPEARPTTLRVYAPHGGAIAVATAGAAALANGAPLTVEGLFPGPRVLRLERDGVRLAPRPVLLLPGPNVLTLRERMP